MAEPQRVFTNEHLDLRITHNSENAEHPLSLALVGSGGTVFPLSNSVVQALESAQLTLPGGTDFGPEGSTLWVLPQSQNPGLVYLGLSAEGLPASLSEIAVTLTALEGPGAFFLWQANQFGGLEVRMNSRDGISEADRIRPLLGSHEHANWGFTSNGVYRVTFVVSARQAGVETNVMSEPQTLVFQVLPLPELPQTPFQRWQQERFGSRNGAAAAAADPDGDGYVNAAEYAFGQDPNVFTAARYPKLRLVQENGERFAELEFPRNAAASDARFGLESADSLNAPQWTALETGSFAETGSGAGFIRLRDPRPATSGAQRFYRLRIELIP